MTTRPAVRHVIYLHGFASSPASGKARRFGRELELVGVGFSCPDFNEPEFESLTTTRMLAQTAAAIQAAPEGPVALIGSSLGAFVAVHAAARDRTQKVDRLILLAPALDFGGDRLTAFGPHTVEEWRRQGALTVFHYAQAQDRRIDYGLYADASGYDALPLPTRLPTLVFQGTQDDVVSPAMVQAWAADRELVDLRLVTDGHQLADSMDSIWAESARFLGLA